METFSLDDTSLSIIIDEIICYVRGNAAEEFEKDNLKKDCAYIHDGHCYIYGGKLPEITEHGYFYKNGKNLVYIPAIDMETNKVEYIRNTKKIKQEMADKDNMKEIVDEVDTSDIRIFAPPIKDTDDYLKVSVKKILLELQIDLRQYRHKFNKEYDITNLKASVTKEAPMSMKYYLRWMEVLGCNVEIRVKSKSSAVFKLKKPVITEIV